MRHLLTPVRMAMIKKARDSKCWQGCGEKGTLVHSCWECKLVQLPWKTVWRYLKKLNIELPYDPTIPLLGVQRKQNHYLKEISVLPYSLQPLFTIAKVWKQPKCPLTNKWIKKT